MEILKGVASATLCWLPLSVCFQIARFSERDWNMRQRQIWDKRIGILFLTSFLLSLAFFLIGRPDAILLIAAGMLAIKDRI